MTTTATPTNGHRKAHGRLWLDTKTRDVWHLTAAPHVVVALRRCFPRVILKDGTFRFRHEPLACSELEWFAMRYPLDVIPRDELERMARKYDEQLAEWESIDADTYTPAERKLALPLRKYQAQGVDLYLSRGSLLLGDEVGLGKTAVVIGSYTDPRTLPGIVVCYPHLQRQWKREIEKFLPGCRVHIVKGQPPLPSPRPDVVILTYMRLDKWWQYLQSCGFKSIAWDECQELRRDDSDKYRAAVALRQYVKRAIGLSATPIYNHGGEIFNVLEAIEPGALGERDEFRLEWCKHGGDHAGKWPLKDPKALGSYLRAQKLMLRRTRTDVGRELPPVSRYTQLVDHDEALGASDKLAAIDLAKMILRNDHRGRAEAMQEAGEFLGLIRKATGLAKADSVAEFTKLLLDQGEPVILGGWHHGVYERWAEKLKDYNPVWYTGQQSEGQKNKSRDAFLAGKTKLMILSVRSGVGLNGLEGVCRNVVFGEFDWSPGPHKQFIGRVHRDGQTLPVFVYFLYCDWGSDPTIVEVLGLKEEQHAGVNDPWMADAPELDDRSAYNRVRDLASAYLQRNG